MGVPAAPDAIILALMPRAQHILLCLILVRETSRLRSWKRRMRNSRRRKAGSNGGASRVWFNTFHLLTESLYSTKHLTLGCYWSWLRIWHFDLMCSHCLCGPHRAEYRCIRLLDSWAARAAWQAVHTRRSRGEVFHWQNIDTDRKVLLLTFWEAHRSISFLLSYHMRWIRNWFSSSQFAADFIDELHPQQRLGVHYATRGD